MECDTVGLDLGYHGRRYRGWRSPGGRDFGHSIGLRTQDGPQDSLRNDQPLRVFLQVSIEGIDGLLHKKILQHHFKVLLLRRNQG